MVGFESHDLRIPCPQQRYIGWIAIDWVGSYMDYLLPRVLARCAREGCHGVIAAHRFNPLLWRLRRPTRTGQEPVAVYAVNLAWRWLLAKGRLGRGRNPPL